jgi:hypothetical protein
MEDRMEANLKITEEMRAWRRKMMACQEMTGDLSGE